MWGVIQPQPRCGLLDSNIYIDTQQDDASRAFRLDFKICVQCGHFLCLYLTLFLLHYIEYAHIAKYLAFFLWHPEDQDCRLLKVQQKDF